MRIASPIAFGLMLILTPSSSKAQSFDCGQASSAIEKAICGDLRLSGLDATLDAVFRHGLKHAGEARNSLLFDQRNWIANRNLQCADQSKTKFGSPRCLVSAYRSRIAEIEARISALDPGEENARIRPCREIVENYSATISANPRTAFSKNPEFATLAAEPFDVWFLANDAGRFLKEIDASPKGDQGEKDEERARVKAIMESLPRNNPRGDRIIKIPGSGVFADVGTDGGTLLCWDSNTFVVKNGRARLIAEPPSWEGACNTRRYYGTMDGLPIAVDIDSDPYGETLTSTVRFSRWSEGYFGPACAARFTFDPAFFPYPASSFDFAGSDEKAKDPMVSAVMPMVEAVQKSPAEARSAALAGLTEAQRKAYLDRLKGEATDNPNSSAIDDPGPYTARRPLYLPFVHDSAVFSASVGHVEAPGPIWTGDWAVTLEDASGQTHEFVIGVGKGKLASVEVR